MKEDNKYMNKIKSLVSNIWYVVILVAVCVTVTMLIVHWQATLTAIGKLISILMPFILGFIFAYMITPFIDVFVRWFDHIKPGENMKIKKIVGMILSYVIIIGVITILIIYIAPQITESVKRLGVTVTNGYNNIKDNPYTFLDKIPFINTNELLEEIKNSINDIVMELGTNVFPYIYKISTSVFVIAYDVFFGLVISIYFVMSKRNIAKSFRRTLIALLPGNKGVKTWEVLLDVNRIFNGFLIGKMYDSLIIGTISLIVMLILNMPYAVLLSVIVGITNMIPYFGPFIGAVPGVVIYFFIDPKMSFGYIIFILVLQQFDGWILGPKILGDQTGIKPLSVILGVTIGGAYFGVLGMFLGVPAVAVLWYLGERLIVERFKKKGMKDPKYHTAKGEDPEEIILGDIEEADHERKNLIKSLQEMKKTEKSDSPGDDKPTDRMSKS